MNSKIVSFADDTTVTNACYDGYKSFADDMRLVSNWFIDDHLTVNPEKCCHMTFGRKPKNVKTSKATSETGNTNSCKYLGLIVGSSLKFVDQIKKVQNKLCKFCGVMYKARYVFSRANFLIFYNAYAKSLIQYAVLFTETQTKF